MKYSNPNIKSVVHPMWMLVGPGALGECRALPCDVQAFGIMVEMKVGLESAPAYSYGRQLRRNNADNI